MGDAAGAANGGRKRKRSAAGCVHEGNNVVVEELKKIRLRLRDSSHLASNYNRAIASIQAYPTPIRDGREAKQLKNIGNYMANQIQAILTKQRPHTPAEPAAAAVPVVRPEPAFPPLAAEPERGPRVYAPARGKQPWFVLLALAEAKAESDETALPLDDLLRSMQQAGYDGNLVKLKACLAPLCATHEVAKRTASGGVFLTAKGLRSAASPRRDEDCNLGVEAVAVDSPVDFDCDTEPDPDLPTLSERLQRRIAMPVDDLSREGDEWELVLLLDHREILSRRNRSILERKLLERNVTCDVRSLNVGDVQWVARRHRVGHDPTEFMLNAIVERKEVHDLSGSIIDRRYTEQKLRLGACGLTHVIYLVEGSLTQQTTVRTGGLETAMCRTQVQNQFFVQACQNADESVDFLARVHARLLAKFPRRQCRNRELSDMAETSRRSPFLPPLNPSNSEGDIRRLFCSPVQTFSAFNSQFRKKSQFSAGEMIQMMLMQAPGLSAAKTAGLTATYRTFHELCAALQKHGRESQVEHIRCGENQRRLGVKAREALGILLTARDYSLAATDASNR